MQPLQTKQEFSSFEDLQRSNIRKFCASLYRLKSLKSLWMDLLLVKFTIIAKTTSSILGEGHVISDWINNISPFWLVE